MFGNIFKKATTKLNGKKDLLEACAAAAILIAKADGEIEDSELAAVADQIMNNDKLTSSFSMSEIEAAIEKQRARAKSKFTGSRDLWKEIDDVARRGDAEDNETIALIALEVSSADGEIEPAEKAVLRELGQRLKVDIQRLINMAV